MYKLSGFQRDCLVAIAGGDSPKGLDIKAELDRYYGTEINHGRLYPNLNALVDAGLVEKDEIDGRTNAYSVTEEGRELLAERFEWEDQYVDF